MMNVRKLTGILLSLVLLLGLPVVSHGQVQVERSTEKAVIGGIPYYLHTVRKGETTYSISRAYGISIGQLSKYNPGLDREIKENQVLRIPVSMVPVQTLAPSTPVKQAQRDENKYIYHVLQQGETVYFLSKKYNVGEDEIIHANPGIDISKLPLGSEIAIPRREKITTIQIPGPPDTKYYYHKVLMGETLSSIARKYGLTLRALRRENKDQRFPQVGDYIRIPGLKPMQAVTEPPVIIDTVPKTVENKVVMLEKPEAWTPVTSLRGSLNIAVLLPFYLSENSKRIDVDSSQSVKGKWTYNIISRSDDWIYPRSVGFIEMYQGILLAADTLRALGLNVNIHTFDVKDDTVEITQLIQSGKLDNTDLIIGPVHSKNLSMVAAFAASREIPVVSPVPLKNNDVLAGNPSLFIANPSLSIAQKCIAMKIGDYAPDNIVLISNDTLSSGSLEFKEMILKELESTIPLEQIKLKDYVYYSRSDFGADTLNRLGSTLSDKVRNLVIVDSEDSPVMSESITDIHTLSRKYDVKVIGYPNMRYLDNLDPQICFDLGLMIYSPYWIDYSSDKVKRFLSDYLKKFKSQPSEMSYAWMGYDIAYYFISGLSMHGKAFLNHPEIHNPELLQTEFDFRRKTNSDGFENQKLYLVRYSNNYQLELVNDSQSVP